MDKYVFSEPLSERMRPGTLHDFLGQAHILGPGRILRDSIETDNLHSFILWGPPGSGKTTLASIIKKATSSHLVKLAAVTSGVKDVRRVIEEAEIRRKSLKQKTVLFVDEIHRFNKAQQDAFLPFVEKGTITLIGATTENPYFEVISPLLSRSRVYRLMPISNEHMFFIVNRALEDEAVGLGMLKAIVEPDALELLVNSSGGDARACLNALETAVLLAKPDKDLKRVVSMWHIKEAFQQKRSIYDKSGEAHYNTISAFIKSVRGSDPDGAIFWMARMLKNGEDPKFIARRLIILAAEDIGLADPFALNIANAAKDAVMFVGMPEARIILAEAVIYLACAPKSNSAYVAVEKALKAQDDCPEVSVPLHLCNPVTKGMKGMGYGDNYKYAHDYPGHFIEQQFLPDELKGHRFYHPGDMGHEKRIRVRLGEWWKERFRD